MLQIWFNWSQSTWQTSCSWLSQIYNFTNMHEFIEQERVWPREEMKRAVLFTSLLTLSWLYSQAGILNSMLSRYAYDVNIALHILPLNTFGVCSFITLSVVIKQNELNRLSLPFTDWILHALCGICFLMWLYCVTTFACGKQQINVTECS